MEWFEKLSESQKIFWTGTIRDFAIIAIIVLAIIICWWRPTRKNKMTLRRIKFLIIFFGNRLSEEEFCNNDLRKRTLEDGIELIQANCQDVCIFNRFNVACAIAVKGSATAVKQLESFLDSEGIGYQEDDPNNPPFRAA